MKIKGIQGTSAAAAIAASLVGGITAIGAGVGLAQSETELAEALQACARIDHERRRVACYDRLSRQRAEAPAEPAPAGPEPVAATAERPAPGPEPVAPAVQEPPPRTPEPEPEPEPEATATLEVEAPPEADTREAGSSTVTVTSVQTNQLGNTTIVTADGRVWRRVSRQRGRFPEPPFEASLEIGSMGSYFLRLPSSGTRVRVALRD